MRLKLEHRLGVATPADIIWEIIADLPRWTDWNPIHPRADGVIAFGASLDVDLIVMGQPPQRLSPKVISWTPNELLHWQQKDALGLLVSTRYIEIDTLAETGCIFSNGELFEGLAVRFMPKHSLAARRAGFVAMGEAMKVRAETLWAERQLAN